MSQLEIAEKYDVVKSAICYQMKKHGIEARDRKEIHREKSRKKPVPLDVSDYGYRWWVDQYGKKKGWDVERVFVHRLVHVAHHGVESVKNMDVHHKNGHKLDNRPENLEAMSKSDHSKLHADESSDLVGAVP
jgi:hypothetical protein